MSITPEKLKKIRAALEISLEVIGEAHDVEFAIGKMTYSDSDFRCELRAGDTSGGESLARIEWDKGCRSIGFTPEDYGKNFSLLSEEVYRIVGLKLKNRKYPIIAEKNGLRYKFDPYTVRAALRREATPA